MDEHEWLSLSMRQPCDSFGWMDVINHTDAALSQKYLDAML